MDKMIGAGNFAKVFKAYNNLCGRVCALKVIKKDNLLQMKQVDHVISERQVLNLLSNLRNNNSVTTAESNNNLNATQKFCPFIVKFYSSF